MLNSPKETTIEIVINGRNHVFPSNITILEACQAVGIYIPTLCHHADLPACGKCGLCVVRVNGNSFAYACMTKLISPGMTVDTNCPDVIAKARRAYNNFIDMSVPPPSRDIEEIARYLFPKNAIRTREHDKSHSIEFDPSFCINCGRCVRMCSDIQNIGALNYVNPRIRMNECISCGQCITVCPTQALVENHKAREDFLRALSKKSKILVLQIAPASRVAVGEGFGLPPGTIVTGKIVQAAREIGFNYVFDTNFGADVNLYEEGFEFLRRMTGKQNNCAIPQFTSCCPAWINYVERLHQELIPHLSTVKSPHIIVGRLVKTYFAQKNNINPKNIVMVSLMPCVAKKDEIRRMQVSNDVDIVLTSREFIDIVKDFGIDFTQIKDSKFDEIMGVSSGSGQLFGTTGGIAESCVRFLHKKLLNQNSLGKIEYNQFRGMKTIKTAEIVLGDQKIRIAVCNGINAASELIESEKYKDFHFVEVMACPGGCIGGAGQPKIPKRLIECRMKSIFQIDSENPAIRVCDENPQVLEIYKRYFNGLPGCQKAIEYLHTHFEPHETAILAQKKRLMTMPVVGYGSVSGTAMRLGRIVANFIKTTSISLNSLSIKQLISRKIAIFIISTTGEGELPTNSKKFINELMNSTEELSMVRFAVLGLGNTDYKYYCEAGNILSGLLEQHLAKPILPLTNINTALEDRGEAAFERWCHQLCSTLKLDPPKIGIHLNYNLVPEDDDTIVANPLRPVTFEMASLRNKKLITSPLYNDNDKSNKENYSNKENSENRCFDVLNLYQIKLPNGLSCSSGDMIEILPENPDDLTDKVIEALKLKKNQVYKLISNDSTIETFVPEKVSVKQLFSQFMDLNGPPSRAILRAFLEVANPEGVIKLNKLLDVQNKAEIADYMKDVNTADFICEFVKYGIPSIDLIMSSCPHTKPRSYFVSSSPLKNRNTVDIVVLKHKFGINKNRNGLCSTFLDRIPLSKKLPIRIVSCSFQLPEDIGAPVIMAAIGCGIAPFLGMVQTRSINRGPNILIFECDSAENYSSVIEIIENEKKNGNINEVIYCYSNSTSSSSEDNNEKKPNSKAMEDAFLKNKKLIWDYWMNEKTVFYYCGTPGRTPDTLKKALINITIEEGGLNVEEADVYSKRHQVFIEAF